ncbi:MAG: class I SAM-dependent methyltransferase [Alphaproteobacteria bacterium]|nr:class I SAM-dependent methyltransferase [Alphaproteobacteria bacterium]
MSFYGPKDKIELRLMFEHLAALQKLLKKSNVPCYFADNLIAVHRNMTFLYDEKFMSAFSAAKGKDDAEDEAKLWRLHTLAWCGHAALNAPGDFVECGVYKGLYSAMLTDYLDWGEIDRRFYLYDTFAGLPEDWSSTGERESVNVFYDWEGTYENVCQRFARFPNVDVIKGVVPDIFAERAPTKIALLHLDLNAAQAEIAALDVLASRLSHGAIVLMDDYGRREQLALAEALTGWWQEHDHHILELPTGQGMVTINAAKLQS